MTAITPSLEHFHGIADDPLAWLRYEPYPIEKLSEMTRKWEITTTTTEELCFNIRAHHHPYAAELTAALLQGSVAGLQATDTALKDGRSLAAAFTPDQYLLYDGEAFVRRYDPNKDTVVTTPVRDLDFQPEGAYAVYNWELFYHVPMAVALHLSRNRRFAEAQRWLHYIFDPTDASEGPIERFWKVQPFQLDEVELIGEVMEALATSANATPEQLALRQRTINAIAAWRSNPFRPHLVARTRPGAYKVRTLMAYLDNLIAWADSIFQQDTAESVDEAAMLYIRAAQLLGPRPQRTPARGTLGAQSYRTLRNDLDEFGNALRTLEAGLAFDLAPPASEPPGTEGQLANLRSIGQTLYFCVPGNEKLLAYWDTVADRLFKIRNSLNLQGVFRQLPLFDPPIDPALLARGIAAGLDIPAVLAESHQPLAPMRFAWWSRQALELCQEARALGATLLQAMEREDADTLAALRVRHETVILAAMETVRYGQLAEARKQREGQERVITAAFQRYRHFEQLLGRKPDEITLPEIEALDAEGLDGLKYKNSEPEIVSRTPLYDHVEGLEEVTGGHLLNRHEAAEILLSRAASGTMAAASQLDATAALFGAMPNFVIAGMFWGVGPSVQFGPQQVASAVQSMAASVRGTATLQGSGSQDAARLGGFTRREQEWANQSNAAASDISLAFKQLRAGQIREAMAARELDIQRKQIAQAREIEAFLTDERSLRMAHAALFGWLRRETRGLYARALDFATSTAHKAQRAFEYELGTPGASYIQATYADGNEGLLAADRLMLDLRRMEVEFHEKNRRELEVSEDFSLLQLAPAALVMLRTEGKCEVSIEEAMLDQRTPGQYFRRLKNVGVTIPCLTGPYTRVHCTLRLVKSSMRVIPTLRDGRYEQDVNDERFRELAGMDAAIVTSGAQSDNGLFAGGTGDERYLPFEGHGAISTWQLELPRELRQFDYSTISDVVLHMQYTAREGIPKQVAIDAFMARLKARGCFRLFSIRQEFPNVWAALGIGEGTSDFASAEVTLRREHFPYWASSFETLTVNTIDFYALTEKPPRLRASTAGKQVSTQMVGSERLFSAVGVNVDSLSQIPGLLKFDVHCPKKTDDVWFVVAWKVEE